MDLRVKLQRNAKFTTQRFADYFTGFENVDAVKRIFGDKTVEVLSNWRVEFTGTRSYMGVSDIDGHLVVSANYFNSADEVDIYLDVIHELVHIRQYMEGKELFDRGFTYVERPTEVEAYCYAVNEAKRIGLDDQRILEYLKTEWMSEEELTQLAKTVGVIFSDTSPRKGKRLRRRF